MKKEIEKSMNWLLLHKYFNNSTNKAKLRKTLEKTSKEFDISQSLQAFYRNTFKSTSSRQSQKTT